MTTALHVRLFELLGFEAATLSSSSVGVRDMPSPLTLEQVADKAVRAAAPVEINGTQPKLEYVSLKSGRSALVRWEIPPLSPSIPVRVSLQYLKVKGSKLVVVMFRAPLTDETYIRTIADQVMDAFRFVD